MQRINQWFLENWCLADSHLIKLFAFAFVIFNGFSGEVKGRSWRIRFNTDIESFNFFAKCIGHWYVIIPINSVKEKKHEHSKNLWKNYPKFTWKVFVWQNILSWNECLQIIETNSQVNSLYRGQTHGLGISTVLWANLR